MTVAIMSLLRPLHELLNHIVLCRPSFRVELDFIAQSGALTRITGLIDHFDTLVIGVACIVVR